MQVITRVRPRMARGRSLLGLGLVLGLGVGVPTSAGGDVPQGEDAPGRPSPSTSPHPEARPATAADLAALHEYIRKGWTVLTRTQRDLPTAAVDPKFPDHTGPWPVYLARRENLKAIRARLAALLTPAELSRIDLRRLPRSPERPTEPGLLYLPEPYVVPGGRFNEMYGWDSYFIVRGLLRQDEVARAQHLVNDAVYEAATFGKVLNANRTYYLQRSQPPFLTAMIRAVFERTHDRVWLAWTLPAIRAQYRYWTTAPHLAGTTGLSRYRALGAGPAAEVVAGERDADGKNHYDRVRIALRTHPPSDIDVKEYYDRRHDTLTPLFYVADRSMRESGFDPSDRFGAFSLGVMDYAPVCLNSLLFAMERDMALFLEELGGLEAPRWRRAAEARARTIRTLLWNEEHGVFVDYDFVTGRQRWYPFATMFFPLWVGVATPEQARRVASVGLSLLRAPGGLATSTRESGNQWDAPFGWAPLQLIAVEGLRRQGLNEDADAIAMAFLGTVLKEFVEHGTVFEKYDVRRRAAEVSPGIRFGYASNEVGFGWTNGVFLELEAGLSPTLRLEIPRTAAAYVAPGPSIDHEPTDAVRAGRP